MKITFIAVAAVLLSGVDPLRAETHTLVLGQGGVPWDELGERVVGLESVSVDGVLQPLELLPHQNIIAGPRTESGEYTTILGSSWQLGKQPKRDDFELGGRLVSGPVSCPSTTRHPSRSSTAISLR